MKKRYKFEENRSDDFGPGNLPRLSPITTKYRLPFGSTLFGDVQRVNLNFRPSSSRYYIVVIIVS